MRDHNHAAVHLNCATKGDYEPKRTNLGCEKPFIFFAPNPKLEDPTKPPFSE